MLKKTISAIVIFFFAVNSTFGAVPGGALIPERFEKLLAQTVPLSIPEDLGSIIHRAEGEGPLVIHIQDAHANYEAQINMKKILRDFAENHGVSLVGLEGASGDLKPELFRFFPVPEADSAMMDFLVKEGELTGPESFAIESKDSKVEWMGLEDKELYRHDLAIFQRTLKEWDSHKTFIDKAKSELAGLKAKFFSPELRKFDAKRNAFSEGKRSLFHYGRYLQKAAARFLALDLADPKAQLEYPNLVRLSMLSQMEAGFKKNAAAAQKEGEALVQALKAGKAVRGTEKDFAVRTLEGLKGPAWNSAVPARYFFEMLQGICKKEGIDLGEFVHFRDFAKYTILQNEMDAKDFFGEISAVEEKIYGKLIRTEEERGMLALGRDLRLLEKFLCLEVSREEHADFRRRGSEAVPSVIARRLQALGSSGKAAEEDFVLLDQAMRDAEAFYALAMKREGAFIDRLLSRAREKKVKQAVLISGGFHTPGIRKLLEERNIAHIVVSPRVKEADNSGTYHNAILNGKTSLETFLEKENPDRVRGARGDKIAPALKAVEQAVYAELNPADPLRQEKVALGALVHAVAPLARHLLEMNPLLKADPSAFAEALNTYFEGLRNHPLVHDDGVRMVLAYGENGNNAIALLPSTALRREAGYPLVWIHPVGTDSVPLGDPRALVATDELRKLGFGQVPAIQAEVWQEAASLGDVIPPSAGPVPEFLSLARNAAEQGLISKDALRNIQSWTSPAYHRVHDQITDEFKKAAENPEAWKQINDSWYNVAKPGTAGIRGTRGNGTNRMNEYTLGLFQLGHALAVAKPEFDEIAKEFDPEFDPAREKKAVVLGGDSRHGSYDPVSKGPGQYLKLEALFNAASGVRAYVYRLPVSTPQLAWSVHELDPDPGYQIVSGSMTTASHNPASDNGNKPYKPDGSQSTGPFANLVNQTVSETTPEMLDKLEYDGLVILDNVDEAFDRAIKNGDVVLVGGAEDRYEADRKFIEKELEEAIHVVDRMFDPKKIDLKNAKIVISCLYGVTRHILEQLLRIRGLQEDQIVWIEDKPDPDFPGVGGGKPNPEFREARLKGILKGIEVDADFIMWADPDSDRPAVAAKIDPSRKAEKEEDYLSLTGNMQLAVLTDYLLREIEDLAREESSADDERRSALAREAANIACHWSQIWMADTVVSSDLMKVIARTQGLKMVETLVGFKYIGDEIEKRSKAIQKTAEVAERQWRKLLKREKIELAIRYSENYLFGGEETLGSLSSDGPHDKDAIAGQMWFVELMGRLMKQGVSLAERFDEMYRTYGYFREGFPMLLMGKQYGKRKYGQSEEFSEQDAMDIIKAVQGPSILNLFRQDPPKEIAGKKVIAVLDFEKQEARNPEGELLFDANSHAGLITPQTPDIPESFRAQLAQIPVPDNDKVRPDNRHLLQGIYSFAHGPVPAAMGANAEVQRLPKENFIMLLMEDGSKVIPRPSGTEPIIKIYVNGRGLYENRKILDRWITDAQAVLEEIADGVAAERFPERFPVASGPKDYSEMSLKELDVELVSVAGMSEEELVTMEAIVDAIFEKTRDKANILQNDPFSLMNSLLAALGTINGSTDEANKTRYAVARAYHRILHQTEDWRKVAAWGGDNAPALLVSSLKSTHGVLENASRARQFLARALMEILLKRAYWEQIPRTVTEVLEYLEETVKNTAETNAALVILAAGLKEIGAEMEAGEYRPLLEAVYEILKFMVERDSKREPAEGRNDTAVHDAVRACIRQIGSLSPGVKVPSFRMLRDTAQGEVKEVIDTVMSTINEKLQGPEALSLGAAEKQARQEGTVFLAGELDVKAGSEASSLGKAATSGLILPPSVRKEFKDAEHLEMNPAYSKVYHFNGKGYRSTGLLVPKAKGLESIDEEKLLALVLDPRPGFIKIIVENDDAMTYATMYLIMRLMEMAQREFTFGLATGGTTEALRKGLGLMDLAKEIFGMHPEWGKARGANTLDDYIWRDPEMLKKLGKDDFWWPEAHLWDREQFDEKGYELKFELGAYRNEQKYMLLRNAFPHLTDEEIDRVFVSPPVLFGSYDEAEARFIRNMSRFKLESERSLFTLSGLGTGRHDGFTESQLEMIALMGEIVNDLRKILRIPDTLTRVNYPASILQPDGLQRHSETTQVQNFGHFGGEMKLHKGFLRLMGKLRINFMEDLINFSMMHRFEDIQAFLENGYGFASKEEFLREFQKLLDNFSAERDPSGIGTPPWSMTQKTGDVVERAWNPDTVKIVMVGDQMHKKESAKDSFPDEPNPPFTPSALYLAPRAVLIATELGASKMSKEGAWFFTSGNPNAGLLTSGRIEEKWGKTGEGRRVAGVKQAWVEKLKSASSLGGLWSGKTTAEDRARAEALLAEHERIFNKKAAVVAKAPGRANIIGEHVDYPNPFPEDGSAHNYSVPFALPFNVLVAGSAAPADASAEAADTVRLHSMEYDKDFTFRISELEALAARLAGDEKAAKKYRKEMKDKEELWAQYFMGIYLAAKRRGYDLRGGEFTVQGNVPLGAGVSSSAALCVSATLAAAQLFGWKIAEDKTALGLMAREGEVNPLVGSQCGTMDQAASIRGEKNSAVLIDHGDMSQPESVGLSFGDYEMVLVNSNVQRELAETAYNQRVKELGLAVPIMNRLLGYAGGKGKKHVSAFTIDEFRAIEEAFNAEDSVLMKRVRHVLNERQRVLNFIGKMKDPRIKQLLAEKRIAEAHELIEQGLELIDESGDSLSMDGDFQISGRVPVRKSGKKKVRALDWLVEIGRERSEGNRVFGRMMGGGGGGCAIFMVKKQHLADWKARVAREYEAKTGIKPAFYEAVPSDGAEIAFHAAASLGGANLAAVVQARRKYEENEVKGEAIRELTLHLGKFGILGKSVPELLAAADELIDFSGKLFMVLDQPEEKPVVLLVNTPFADSCRGVSGFLNSGRRNILALKGPRGVFDEFYFDGHPKGVGVSRDILARAGIAVPESGILDPMEWTDEEKARLKAAILNLKNDDELRRAMTETHGIDWEAVETFEREKFETLKAIEPLTEEGDARKVTIPGLETVPALGRPEVYANMHILDLVVRGADGQTVTVQTYKNSPVITDEVEILGVGPQTVAAWQTVVQNTAGLIIFGDLKPFQALLGSIQGGTPIVAIQDKEKPLFSNPYIWREVFEMAASLGVEETAKAYQAQFRHLTVRGEEIKYQSDPQTWQIVTRLVYKTIAETRDEHKVARIIERVLGNPAVLAKIAAVYEHAPFMMGATRQVNGSKEPDAARQEEIVKKLVSQYATDDEVLRFAEEELSGIRTEDGKTLSEWLSGDAEKFAQAALLFEYTKTLAVPDKTGSLKAAFASFAKQGGLAETSVMQMKSALLKKPAKKGILFGESTFFQPLLDDETLSVIPFLFNAFERGQTDIELPSDFLPFRPTTRLPQEVSVSERERIRAVAKLLGVNITVHSPLVGFQHPKTKFTAVFEDAADNPELMKEVIDFSEAIGAKVLVVHLSSREDRQALRTYADFVLHAAGKTTVDGTPLRVSFENYMSKTRADGSRPFPSFSEHFYAYREIVRLVSEKDPQALMNMAMVLDIPHFNLVPGLTDPLEVAYKAWEFAMELAGDGSVWPDLHRRGMTKEEFAKDMVSELHLNQNIGPILFTIFGVDYGPDIHDDVEKIGSIANDGVVSLFFHSGFRPIVLAEQKNPLSGEGLLLLEKAATEKPGLMSVTEVVEKGKEVIAKIRLEQQGLYEQLRALLEDPKTGEPQPYYAYLAGRFGEERLIEHLQYRAYHDVLNGYMFQPFGKMESLPLFNGIGVVTLAPGEEFITQQTTLDKAREDGTALFYMVVDGQAEVERDIVDEHGGPLSVHRPKITAGFPVGEGLFLSHDPVKMRNATVKAGPEGATLVSLTEDAFWLLYSSVEAFRKRIDAFYANREDEVRKITEEWRNLSPEKRVQWFFEASKVPVPVDRRPILKGMIETLLEQYGDKAPLEFSVEIGNNGSMWPLLLAVAFPKAKIEVVDVEDRSFKTLQKIYHLLKSRIPGGEMGEISFRLMDGAELTPANGYKPDSVSDIGVLEVFTGERHAALRGVSVDRLLQITDSKNSNSVPLRMTANMLLAVRKGGTIRVSSGIDAHEGPHFDHAELVEKLAAKVGVNVTRVETIRTPVVSTDVAVFTVNEKSEPSQIIAGLLEMGLGRASYVSAGASLGTADNGIVRIDIDKGQRVDVDFGQGVAEHFVLEEGEWKTDAKTGLKNTPVVLLASDRVILGDREFVKEGMSWRPVEGSVFVSRLREDELVVGDLKCVWTGKAWVPEEREKKEPVLREILQISGTRRIVVDFGSGTVEHQVPENGNWTVAFTANAKEAVAVRLADDRIILGDREFVREGPSWKAVKGTLFAIRLSENRIQAGDRQFIWKDNAWKPETASSLGIVAEITELLAAQGRVFEEADGVNTGVTERIHEKGPAGVLFHSYYFGKGASLGEKASGELLLAHESYLADVSEGLYRTAFSMENQEGEFAVLATTAEDISVPALERQLELNKQAYAVVVFTGTGGFEDFERELKARLKELFPRVELVRTGSAEETVRFFNDLAGSKRLQAMRSRLGRIGLSQSDLARHITFLASEAIVSGLTTNLAVKLAAPRREDLKGITADEFRLYGNTVGFALARLGGDIEKLSRVPGMNQALARTGRWDLFHFNLDSLSEKIAQLVSEFKGFVAILRAA